MTNVHPDWGGWLDPKLPVVTEEAMSKAFEDFPLPLVKFDADWLAMAVRRCLALAEPDKHPRTALSRTRIRDDLRNLAETARDLWLSLESLGREQEEAVWDFLHSQGVSMELLAEKRRNLFELFNVLVATANTVASGDNAQNARWRQAAERAIRVERGYMLAPVFEVAYSKVATVNDFPSGKSTAQTSFMDFYQRCVAVAFGERCTPDISGVLKKAILQHRKQPVLLAPGLVPGLTNLMVDASGDT